MCVCRIRAGRLATTALGETYTPTCTSTKHEAALPLEACRVLDRLAALQPSPNARRDHPPRSALVGLQRRSLMPVCNGNAISVEPLVV